MIRHTQNPAQYQIERGSILTLYTGKPDLAFFVQMAQIHDQSFVDRLAFFTYTTYQLLQ